jgi:hypothetical protein
MQAPALQPVPKGQQWWFCTVVPQHAPLYCEPTHSTHVVALPPLHSHVPTHEPTPGLQEVPGAPPLIPPHPLQAFFDDAPLHAVELAPVQT